MEECPVGALDSISVETWLLELRMECYRRQLEDFPNLKSVVNFKDTDLKKLGIQNAKDRATMIGSLSNYRSHMKSEGINKRVQSAPSSHDHHHIGALIKKGSTLKIKKLKGLLGGSGSSKGQQKVKKGQDVQTSPSSEEKFLHTIPEIKTSVEDFSRSLPSQAAAASFGEFIQGTTQKPYAIENDYVPDPQGSPQMPRHYPLQRSYTVSEQAPFHKDALLRPSHPRAQSMSNQAARSHFDHFSLQVQDPFHGIMDDDGNPNKHLSVVSMESGLGLTCDTDERDDFNRSLPLEQQPWFYGPMAREQVESLLDQDGDFLVIEDTITHGSYILSLLWEGRIFHVQINCNEIVVKNLRGVEKTGQKYQFGNGAFDSVPELIFNHLRYRIPLSTDFDGVLINPICHDISSNEYESSLLRPYGTLPRNFGRSIDSNLDHAMANADYYTMVHPKRASFRATRSASFSPSDSPRNSPIRDTTSTPKASLLNQASYSSSNLLGDTVDEDEMSDMAMASLYRDAPSSPATIYNEVDGKASSHIPDVERPRTIDPYSTYDIPVPSKKATDMQQSPLSHTSSREKYDQEDYEVMESVSIRSTLPPSPNLARSTNHRSKSPSLDIHYSTVTPKSLRHERSVPILGKNAGVKYAEITFKRSMSSAAHADVLERARAQTVTYATPRIVQENVSTPCKTPPPHPFSTYSQLSFSSPSSSKNSRLSPSSTPCPKKHSRRSHGSRPSSESPYSSRPTSVSSGKNIKPPQAIADIPSFLKEFSNDEVAMHLTKADAVCFLLTPRPGEDHDLWTNRVQELNTDGVFVGLEVLASQSGEKLWKKLFYRHLGLSQLVIVNLLHTSDVIERAKMLKRWIEIAELLQSGKCGNLFSFMAIMKGLESTQVIDMKRTWGVLKTHYTDTHTAYQDTLKGMISALSEGASIYDIEQLVIPAIQHLRKLYTEDSNSQQDMRLILEDFTTRTVGLDGLHSIVAHTADLSLNAKRKLGSYTYEPLLFDFLMQDCARMHLQNMGTSSDDPLERYRRFNIVLDALLSKIDNP